MARVSNVTRPTKSGHRTYPDTVVKASPGVGASHKLEREGALVADTASDLMLERLMDWGVDTIFGLPGDGINGFMEALRKRHGEIRYIHVRHEEVAAMAAVGYAKLTGKLGVCFATAGPGAIHLANGLLDARLDGAPLLAI